MHITLKHDVMIVTVAIFFLEHHIGVDGVRKSQFEEVCHTVDADDIHPVSLKLTDDTILGSSHHCSSICSQSDQLAPPVITHWIHDVVDGITNVCRVCLLHQLDANEL